MLSRRRFRVNTIVTLLLVIALAILCTVVVTEYILS